MAVHADVLALQEAGVGDGVVCAITVARGASDLDNSEHALEVSTSTSRSRPMRSSPTARTAKAKSRGGARAGNDAGEMLRDDCSSASEPAEVAASVWLAEDGVDALVGDVFFVVKAPT